MGMKTTNIISGGSRKTRSDQQRKSSPSKSWNDERVHNLLKSLSYTDDSIHVLYANAIINITDENWSRLQAKLKKKKLILAPVSDHHWGIYFIIKYDEQQW